MIQAKGYAAQSAESELATCQFERRGPGPHDVQRYILYCGATITLISASPGKPAAAKALGAHHLILSTDEDQLNAAAFPKILRLACTQQYEKTCTARRSRKQGSKAGGGHLHCRISSGIMA